ncbi:MULTISPECIES: hypothetical protein [Enterobacter cloacae complex]|uniref:hypothetical protein n=1 Tax=Enterobacter cloacae complex TaxID=354276 RepID=UPI0015966DB0|nr:hypothetical protein [Enterobacter hormaechei]MDA4647862.1 hypothetical protein [Enterobacter hormaechei]
MGKRKRNVVTKFERNAQSLLRTSDFQNLSRLSKEYNSVPGEWQTTIIEENSPAMSPDEMGALQDILNSCPGAFWKPRKIKIFNVDSSNFHKWQILNFSSYEHYCGWLSVNHLNNLTRDFDTLFDTKEHYDS